MQRILVLLTLVLLLASCHEKSSSERVAESFLEAYLDCRFAEAERVASPEMVEQMRWRASQLTQTDLDLLAGNESHVSTENVEVCDDSCIVYLKASDALLLDSIGQPGRIGDRHCIVVLKKEKGRNWIVTDLNLLPS